MKSNQQPRVLGPLALMLAAIALFALVIFNAGQTDAKTSQPGGVNAYIAPHDHGTPEGTETEHPEATETEHPEATETEHPEATRTEHPEATRTEHPEATETERPQATETEHPEATETEHPEATETEHPQATETEHPQATETEHPEATETEHPEATGTPDSAPALPGTGSRTFPQTGRTVSGMFLSYWDNHGGLPQQGFPISGLRQETSPLNGRAYMVQYFERATFEYHPENKALFSILLSQLGTFQYRQKYPNGAPNQHANMVGGHFFPETRHWVSGLFWAYWQQHGGLAQQGLPISEEFVEVSPLDGKPYTVQYFERAVFERHPENRAPFDVLLSQLGSFRYRQVVAP